MLNISLNFLLIEDRFFLEVFLILTLSNLLFEKNAFYCLVYLLISFFLLGLYILVFQLDVMVAFFWLAEVTIVFVFVVCVMHLSFDLMLDIQKILIKNYFMLLIMFCLILVFQYFFTKLNIQSSSVFDLHDINLAYYSYSINLNKTDLYGLFLTLYLINFSELLFLIFAIFLLTIILIKMYTFILVLKNYQNYNLFFFYFYCLTTFHYLFKREQNLIKQNNLKQLYKFFSKVKS